MNTPEQLNVIIQIFQNGEESDSYIDAVKFLHKIVLEEQEEGTFERATHFSSLISIHNKLRYTYKADFNGPLLHWYRRFIGLYKDEE